MIPRALLNQSILVATLCLSSHSALAQVAQPNARSEEVIWRNGVPVSGKAPSRQRPMRKDESCDGTRVSCFSSRTTLAMGMSLVPTPAGVSNKSAGLIDLRYRSDTQDGLTSAGWDIRGSAIGDGSRFAQSSAMIRGNLGGRDAAFSIGGEVNQHPLYRNQDWSAGILFKKGGYKMSTFDSGFFEASLGTGQLELPREGLPKELSDENLAQFGARVRFMAASPKAPGLELYLEQGNHALSSKTLNDVAGRLSTTKFEAVIKATRRFGLGASYDRRSIRVNYSSEKGDLGGEEVHSANYRARTGTISVFGRLAR